MNYLLNRFGGGEPIPANYTRLIDMFPDDCYSQPKLIRIEHSRRSNTAELRLLSQISQLTNSFCLDLDGFIRELTHWLQTTSLDNSAKFWTSYALLQEGQQVHVWHTNSQGNPDRHVCTVQPKEPLV